MSSPFYKSLTDLKEKITKNNIVLVTGNINEIFSYNDSIKFINSKDKFISLIDYLRNFGQKKNINYLEYYKEHYGSIDLNNVNYGVKIEDIQFNSKDDETQHISIELKNSAETIEEYTDKICNKLNTIDGENKNDSSLFIINYCWYFSETYKKNDIKLFTKLVDNFIGNNKNSDSKSSKNNNKLVLLYTGYSDIKEFMDKRKIKYEQIKIPEPTYDERKKLFDDYTSNHSGSKKIKTMSYWYFEDSILSEDELTFKDILKWLQLNTIIHDNLPYSNFSLSELYNWSTSHKKESEWEKIDIDKMTNMVSILKERIIGQDEAINTLKTSLIRSFAGLSGITHSKNKKPKGILFLAGPTGTGKTELAKALCEFIFEDESSLLRFDMSEYNHEHSDQRLIGSPPGYIGHDAGGQLTNAIKKKPFSIILFDEIEKAHGKILDKFLQILEDGRLTSSKGEIIDFSETFIIFTSNIGTSEITSQHIEDSKDTSNIFVNAVKQHFNEVLQRPEILNRIGIKNIIPFNFIINKETQYQIIESKMKRIKKTISNDKLIYIKYDNNALILLSDLIISKTNIEYGARGLITELETIFIDELSTFIFENKKTIDMKKSKKKDININMIVVDNQIKFSIDSK